MGTIFHIYVVKQNTCLCTETQNELQNVSTHSLKYVYTVVLLNVSGQISSTKQHLELHPDVTPRESQVYKLSPKLFGITLKCVKPINKKKRHLNAELNVASA